MFRVLSVASSCPQPRDHTLQPEPHALSSLYSEDKSLWTQSPTKKAPDLNSTVSILRHFWIEKLVFYPTPLVLRAHTKNFIPNWDLVFHQSPALYRVWVQYVILVTCWALHTRSQCSVTLWLGIVYENHEIASYRSLIDFRDPYSSPLTVVPSNTRPVIQKNPPTAASCIRHHLNINKYISVTHISGVLQRESELWCSHCRKHWCANHPSLPRPSQLNAEVHFALSK